MAVSKDKLQEDLPWDVSRLAVDPGEHGSDGALAVLDEIGGGQGNVQAVRAYAAADGGRDKVATDDLLRALQQADGRLALVTWTNAGITAIGFRPSEQRFDAGQFSGIDKRMGNDPESYERVTKREATDLLSWSTPSVVRRSESKLLPELEQSEVRA